MLEELTYRLDKKAILNVKYLIWQRSYQLGETYDRNAVLASDLQASPSLP